MKSVLAILLISISLPSCGSGDPKTSTALPNSGQSSAAFLTNDEKHQLYSAALAATESPLESEVYQTVCQRIGIFGPGGSANDSYLQFMSAHVEWALRAETQQFKLEINTREKAGSYLAKHLPR